VKLLFALCFAWSAVAQTASVAPKTSADTKSNEDLLWQKLGDRVREVDHKHQGALGVAITDLTTGRQFLWNADQVFATASSIKVAIAVALFKEGKQNDRYTPHPKDLVAESIILEGLTPGTTQLTLRDVMSFMLIVSDNGATNVLIDRLGFDRVNATLDGLGLGKTRLRRKMIDLEAARQGRENISTPREMAALMEAVYRQKALPADAAEHVLKVMSQPKHGALSRLLAEGVRVADKPGSLDGIRNDIGVIWAGKRPFAIAVMTGYNRDDAAAEGAIAEIGLAAYRMFESLGASSEFGRRLP
jgi:beta-lactamase class A